MVITFRSALISLVILSLYSLGKVSASTFRKFRQSEEWPAVELTADYYTEENQTPIDIAEYYEPLQNAEQTTDYTPPSNALTYETNQVYRPTVVEHAAPVLDYQQPTVTKVEAPAELQYPVPLAFRNQIKAPPQQPAYQKPLVQTQHIMPPHHHTQQIPTKPQQQQHLPQSYWPASYWPQEYPNKEFLEMLAKLRPSPSDWGTY